MSSRSEGFLTRLCRLFAREPPPPAEWLMPGTARPILILVIAMVPFALAGAVRRWTHLTMTPSLLLAAAMVLITSWPLWPALRRRERGGAWHLTLAVAAMSAVGGFACYVLYTRYFGGLTNFRGTDGSYHVFYYHEFIGHDPQIYQGFVSTYAAFYFAQHLFHCNVFWAMCIVFYTGLALVSALPLVISFALLWPLREKSRPAYVFGVVATVAFTLALLYYAILVEQHMYQADGFYPQLFGLLPLFAIWLIDALVPAMPVRWLFMFATLVLLRFTYAVNIGDVVVAFAVMLLVDLGAARGWFRLAMLLLTLAMLYFARTVFLTLWPLQKNVGHFLWYSVARLSDGQFFAGLALLLVVGAAVGRGAPLARGFARAARFPLLVAWTNYGAIELFMKLNGDERYYFEKYPFVAFVLVAAACGAIVPAAIATLAAGWRAHWSARLRAAVVGAGVVFTLQRAWSFWEIGVGPHRSGYLQRAWGKPPFNKEEQNLPLADLGAWKRIDEVLEHEHKRFAGYFISHFPMMMFTNAAFYIPDFGWALWFGGGFKSYAEPGTCFFWDEGPPRDWLVWEYSMTQPNIDLRAKLQRDPAKTCQRYHAHWDPDGPPRVLCHRCW